MNVLLFPEYIFTGLDTSSAAVLVNSLVRHANPISYVTNHLWQFDHH